MLRRSASLTTVLFLAGCATSQLPLNQKSAPPGSETYGLPAELAVVHPALYRGWQGDDAAALRPYYADNAVIKTSTDSFEGWETIHSRWLTPTLNKISGFMATPTSFTREGDTIVERGWYHIALTEAGETQAARGTYEQRWQRSENGLWRVVSAHIGAAEEQ